MEPSNRPPQGKLTPQEKRIDGQGADERSGRALSLRERLALIERRMIVRTLAATQGNRSLAARRLGMSRSALIDRLNKYGLSARTDSPSKNPSTGSDAAGRRS